MREKRKRIALESAGLFIGWYWLMNNYKGGAPFMLETEGSTCCTRAVEVEFSVNKEQASTKYEVIYDAQTTDVVNNVGKTTHRFSVEDNAIKKLDISVKATNTNFSPTPNESKKIIFYLVAPVVFKDGTKVLAEDINNLSEAVDYRCLNNSIEYPHKAVSTGQIIKIADLNNIIVGINALCGMFLPYKTEQDVINLSEIEEYRKTINNT